MAYINFSATLKSSRASAILSAIGTSGLLKIYTGAQPTNPDTAATGTLLATLALSATAGTVSGGVLTFNAITQSDAVATGTAGYARVTTSGGTAVIDLDVGTSATSVILNTTSIVSGGPVVVSSGSITEA